MQLLQRQNKTIKSQTVKSIDSMRLFSLRFISNPKTGKIFFDLPAQFKLFHSHPLIIKELFFFFFLPFKQTNNQSFIHPFTLLTSWIWNLDFIGIGLMPKQTTSLLPSFQNNNSLSLFLLPNNSSR
jgi:hypothetical protein